MLFVSLCAAAVRQQGQPGGGPADAAAGAAQLGRGRDEVARELLRRQAQAAAGHDRQPRKTRPGRTLGTRLKSQRDFCWRTMIATREKTDWFDCVALGAVY